MTAQPAMPDPERLVRRSVTIAKSCGARDNYAAAVTVYSIAVAIMCHDAEVTGHITPWLKDLTDAARQAADEAKPPPANTVRGVLARIGIKPCATAAGNTH